MGARLVPNLVQEKEDHRTNPLPEDHPGPAERDKSTDEAVTRSVMLALAPQKASNSAVDSAVENLRRTSNNNNNNNNNRLRILIAKLLSTVFPLGYNWRLYSTGIPPGIFIQLSTIPFHK